MAPLPNAPKFKKPTLKKLESTASQLYKLNQNTNTTPNAIFKQIHIKRQHSTSPYTETQPKDATQKTPYLMKIKTV